MNGAHLFVVSILIKVILIKGLLHELSLLPGRLPLEDLRVCSTDRPTCWRDYINLMLPGNASGAPGRSMEMLLGGGTPGTIRI